MFKNVFPLSWEKFKIDLLELIGSCCHDGSLFASQMCNLAFQNFCLTEEFGKGSERVVFIIKSN